VGSASRPLTTRDTILLIAHAADNKVEGRTVMQKLAYFTSLGLGSGLGHRAHFYGPYSAKVEDAVANAVIAGELRETVERMPDWRGGPDVLKYTYEITPEGSSRVDHLIENNSDEWDRVRDSVAAVRKVLPELDQKTLSAAAKTYLIISESEGVTESAIPELAKELGWQIDAGQVHSMVDLLERLGLLDNPSDEASQN
jgi:uncharacterized protein YwgA